MAATKKSAKRTGTKERPAAKRQASKKKATRKSASKSRSGKRAAPKTTELQRKARKGLKAARGGLDTVLQAGGKTWETLKSTTAQVVEGVKETLAGESRPAPRRSGSR